MSKAKLSPEFIVRCLDEAENEEAYEAFLSHLSVDELKEFLDSYQIYYQSCKNKADFIEFVIDVYHDQIRKEIDTCNTGAELTSLMKKKHISEYELSVILTHSRGEKTKDQIREMSKQHTQKKSLTTRPALYQSGVNLKSRTPRLALNTHFY